MHITQKYIAKEAQVSQALVSLILSEKAGHSSSQKPLRVSHETRKKVLETAERLGYRSKASSRSGTEEASLWYLGHLPLDGEAVQSSQNFLLSQALLEAVSREGQTLRMRLLTPGSDLRSALKKETVGGVFLGAAIPGLREYLGPKVPIISLGERFLSGGDVILANEWEVMERAVEFLYLSGHTRLALLTAGSEPDTAARQKVAFTQAMEGRGMDAGEGNVHGPDVAEFLDRILDSQQSPETRPTAVIAEEFLALAIQAEAARRGCVLPEDLSLLGLGGSGISVLTTAGVCAREMAHAAVVLMHERRHIPSEVVGAHRKIEIAPTVTDRGSVARQTSLLPDHRSVSEIFPQQPIPAVMSGSQPPIL